MKKIIITVIFLYIFITGPVIAKTAEEGMPSLKFCGAKYTLYYSSKSPEIGGYINEYYKQRESYASWTELIALHHYPKAFYPIEHAKEFKMFLEKSNIPAYLEVDEKNNEAVLDFIVIDDRKLPIVMEFNVFKYVKSPVCGSVGFQYAKRYRVYNALEVDKFRKSFIKTRKKYVKKVLKHKVPELINSDVDYGKYVTKEASSEEPKKEE